MQQQLSEGQATAILALVQKRQGIEEAISELVALYAAKYEMDGATVRQRPDGLWLVLEEEGEGEGKPED